MTKKIKFGPPKTKWWPKEFFFTKLDWYWMIDSENKAIDVKKVDSLFQIKDLLVL